MVPYENCMLPCRIEVTFKADDIAQNFQRIWYDTHMILQFWLIVGLTTCCKKKFTLHFKLPVGSFEDSELVGIRIVLSYSSLLIILIRQDKWHVLMLVSTFLFLPPNCACIVRFNSSSFCHFIIAVVVANLNHPRLKYRQVKKTYPGHESHQIWNMNEIRFHHMRCEKN